MHLTLYTVDTIHCSHCTLFTLYPVHTVYCTVFTLYTVDNIHWSHCTLFTLYIVHTVHYTKLYIVYSTVHWIITEEKIFNNINILNFYAKSFYWAFYIIKRFKNADFQNMICVSRQDAIIYIVYGLQYVSYLLTFLLWTCTL